MNIQNSPYTRTLNSFIFLSKILEMLLNQTKCQKVEVSGTLDQFLTKKVNSYTILEN